MEQRILLTLLFTFAGGACSSGQPSYTALGGGPGHVGSSGGTTVSGGTTTDGGAPVVGGTGDLPTAPCTGDQDGLTPGAGWVISELNLQGTQYVELYNRGPNAADPSQIVFEGALAGTHMPSSSVTVGTYALAAEGLPSAGEIAITLGETLQFYMCWGNFSPTDLETQAESSGFWTGGCAIVPAAGMSLHLRGLGTNAADWVQGPPTPLGCAYTN